MMKKIKQLIITVAMFILAMPAVILAESLPMPSMPPIIVSGTVTINGNIASSGSVSVEGGQITTPIAANISDVGKYSIQVPYENNGEDLTFKVDGEIATSQIVTSPTQKINLAITIIVEPEQTPASPSGGNTSSGGTPGVPLTPLIENKDDQETPKIPVVKGVTDIVVIDGDIIQCKNSSNPFAVYIVKIVGDTKYIRHIVSLEIFNYYGHLNWENLKQVDSLDEYSLSGWVRHNTGLNGTAGPIDKVYEINGDQSKHWINMTAENFLTHGGSEPAIYSVNQGELDLYATGVDVMSL